MRSLYRNLVETVVAPVRAMRLRYLPLLMVYFAYGASGFSAVAESFWVKEKLALSAEALVALGVWLTVPWTIKVVFGQLVDSVPLFGSRRHAYILLGAGLMAGANLMLAGAAGGWIGSLRPEAVYVAAALIFVLGLVIQDVVADAMSTEVVDRHDEKGRPRPEHEVDADLGMVQVLGRIALMLGVFAVAGLGGWLADILPYEDIFLLALAVPAISVAGSLLVRLETVEHKPLDWRILGGGIVFGLVTIAIGIGTIPLGQELIFVLSMATMAFLLWLTIADIDAAARRSIVYAAVVIFVFRAMPTFGPGAQWWQIDVLGFDPGFFGTLGQIGAGIAIVATWLFSRTVTERPVTVVLAWLTVLGALLSLPTVGMYYGLHEWTQRVFGFGAHGIALIDTSLASPFAQLSMVPMLTLIAVHAPPGRRATWFALMASLMNLALQAGALGTKYLNQIFVVERGAYGELGRLMITATAIGFVVPLLTIALVGPRLRAGSSTMAQKEVTAP
ncbi:MAG TPA: hypothetical protein VF342_02995 [Alphaproteobacteria bacterium]